MQAKDEGGLLGVRGLGGLGGEEGLTSRLDTLPNGQFQQLCDKVQNQ